MTFDAMTWTNPPPGLAMVPGSLTVTTAHGSDFWRETFYGFTRTSGHFLHHPVTGDFSAEVTISADYTHLYDQAGLMLRVDDAHWVKCGIEVADDAPVFSTVVTDGASDWSVTPLPFAASPLRLRLTRHGGAVRVQVRQPDGRWLMTRLAHLAEGAAQVGIMACSPERAGFSCIFTEYSCGPAIPRTLHDEAHP